ncbi:hypothetical protein ALC56_14084 [Trachymyrmex septentrionalis]|uniref:Uncharacterized protein n=1 Tax=Trachymyrmex septentrionalis TaxID=34720 RepID=A0A195ETV4_9HYME|nr:hypothetical protein ALC56_14084 [Trachymyrmex septentrionalis]
MSEKLLVNTDTLILMALRSNHNAIEIARENDILLSSPLTAYFIFISGQKRDIFAATSPYLRVILHNIYPTQHGKYKRSCLTRTRLRLCDHILWSKKKNSSIDFSAGEICSSDVSSSLLESPSFTVGVGIDVEFGLSKFKLVTYARDIQSMYLLHQFDTIVPTEAYIIFFFFFWHSVFQ